MSNELAVSNQVPDYMAKYVVQDKAEVMSDLGAIEPSDWGLSFVKIVQSQERHALPGWGPTGQEQPMPQGTYVLNRTHAILPPGTVFVPVLRSRTYIKFRSRNIKDGIDFFTKDKNDPKIVAAKGLEWKDGFDKNGKQARLPPEVSEFINFYVITQYNMEEPAIFSFSKTGMKIGKELTKNLFTVTTQKGLPIYMAQFKLNTPKLREAKGYSWFEPSTQFAGYIKEKSIEHFKQMQTLAKSIEAANQHISDIAANTDKDDGESEGDVPAAMKPVQQQPVINVQASVQNAAEPVVTQTAPVITQSAPVSAPVGVVGAVSELF